MEITQDVKGMQSRIQNTVVMFFIYFMLLGQHVRTSHGTGRMLMTPIPMPVSITQGVIVVLTSIHVRRCMSMLMLPYQIMIMRIRLGIRDSIAVSFVVMPDIRLRGMNMINISRRISRKLIASTRIGICRSATKPRISDSCQ